MSRALLTLLVILAGCSSAPTLPPQPPATVETTDYVEFRTHTEKMTFGTVVYTSPFPDVLFVDWPTADPLNRSREEWSRDSNYVYLDAYSGTTNGLRYPVYSYRTEINGAEVPSPKTGQIYMPRRITGPLTITVWGWIQANDGSFGKLWAWRATLTPMLNAPTPCGPDLDAIKQEETWWDSDGGWLWNPTPSAPFDKDNKPQAFTHSYVRENYMGKGIGQGWLLIENGNMVTCINQEKK